jgi:predicted ATPase with chaperone activity
MLARKEGAGFDLPMALGILGATGMVGSAEPHLFVGELSLDGSIRPVRGALSIAACARKRGIKNLLVPADNAAEAAVADGIDVFGIHHLRDAVAFLKEPAFQPQPRTATAPGSINGDRSMENVWTSRMCAAMRFGNSLAIGTSSPAEIKSNANYCQ